METWGWLFLIGCFFYAIGKFIEFMASIWVLEELKKWFGDDIKSTEMKEIVKQIKKKRKVA